MAYTVKLTNGDILTSVLDGTVNTDSSITLLGKNKTGYGEIVAENFIKLLENQSNNHQPTNPLRGELWYDSDNSVLKVYNGSIFKNLGGATANSAAPKFPIVGDMWFDTSNEQINAYTGDEWKLIGPIATILEGNSGPRVNTITDNVGTAHVVIESFTEGTLLGIWSKDATFTPASAISGFSAIKPGLQLADNVPGAMFNGTAAIAQTLQGYNADDFISALNNDSTVGQISVLNDYGIRVGIDEDCEISVTGDDVFVKNNTLDGDLKLSVNNGGVATTVITLGGSTGTASVNQDPTANLGIATKQYVDSNISSSGIAFLQLTGGSLSGALTLSGDPTDVTHAANKNYVDAKVSEIVSSAPSTLDTLNELASALGDDPNFATTVVDSIGTKLPLAGGTLTGDLTLANNPTSNLQAATKSYVDSEVAGATSSQGSNGFGTRTISTAAPSGGANGDIWYRVS